MYFVSFVPKINNIEYSFKMNNRISITVAANERFFKQFPLIANRIPIKSKAYLFLTTSFVIQCALSFYTEKTERKHYTELLLYAIDSRHLKYIIYRTTVSCFYP